MYEYDEDYYNRESKEDGMFIIFWTAVICVFLSSVIYGIIKLTEWRG